MGQTFKVLFLYPNGTLMNPPPISIGIFTAILREKGFDLGLFDTTLYPEIDAKSSDDAKQENLQVKAFDYASRGVKVKTTNLTEDLRKKIREFKPDLILISMLECTYKRSLELLNVVKEFDIPLMAGGVFPTFSPEFVLSHEAVDMVCVGEGEGAVLELCERMANGQPLGGIKNIYFKKNGVVECNTLRVPMDLNNLPVPDYSLFDLERFFRPMAGKVYKTIPIETNRGCPFTCTFCNSPSISKLYQDNGHVYFRKKRMETITKEISVLVRRWNVEYVYFASDNFLVGSQEELDQFVDFYKDIKLPFWIQTRPETITKEHIQQLKDVGCHRMSIGLEHGNVDFRKNVLKKKFNNDVVIRASEIIALVGIPLTVNNMIGFPDETRELVFDTIELNRRLTSDSMNCSVFAPFHGTSLHQESVKKGYICENAILGSLNTEAPLNMPQLSSQAIQGLRRTFVLYVRLPKEYWPQIRRAEIFDEEGNRILAQLKQIYMEKYVG